MSMISPTPKTPANLEGAFSFERCGYLTSNLEDARRVCRKQGGFLFRIQNLYLVGDYEEAIQWGWRPERRVAHS